MKLRAELASEIIERLHAEKPTQAKAAELIGVTQPRISDLMRGRLNLFSLDALVDMADRVGSRTRIVVNPKRAAWSGRRSQPHDRSRPRMFRYGLSESCAPLKCPNRRAPPRHKSREPVGLSAVGPGGLVRRNFRDSCAKRSSLRPGTDAGTVANIADALCRLAVAWQTAVALG